MTWIALYLYLAGIAITYHSEFRDEVINEELEFQEALILSALWPIIAAVGIVINAIDRIKGE